VGVGLARVPQVDGLAGNADGRLFAPVAGDHLAVQDHMSESLVPGPLQSRAQAGRLRGEHRDDLVHIPVGSGPRDAVVAGQRIAGGAVAEPAQPRNGLPKAAQRPAAARGCGGGAAQRPAASRRTRPVPWGRQACHDRRSRGILQQKIDLVVRPLLLGLHAHSPAARLVRVSAWMPPSGQDKARLSEAISLRSPQRVGNSYQRYLPSGSGGAQNRRRALHANTPTPL
jgi:hypothetical protein